MPKGRLGAEQIVTKLRQIGILEGHARAFLPPVTDPRWRDIWFEKKVSSTSNTERGCALSRADAHCHECAGRENAHDEASKKCFALCAGSSRRNSVPLHQYVND